MIDKLTKHSLIKQKAKENSLKYYNAAVKYFILGQKDEDILFNAINEVYERTGRGDEIYIEVSKLMLEYEFNHEYYKEDINEKVKKIIGDAF